MAQLVYRAVVMRDNAALIASIVPPPSAQAPSEPDLVAVAAPAPVPTRERNWSAGCGRPPPDPLARLNIAGRERQLITVIPENYHANRPHKLVFAFHGRTNANHQVRRYYEIENIWQDASSFIHKGYPGAMATVGRTRAIGQVACAIMPFLMPCSSTSVLTTALT